MAQRSPIWMRAGFCSCTSSISASSMRGSVVKPALAGTGITVLILIRTLSPGLTMLCIPPIVWSAICRIMPLTRSSCSRVYSAGLPRSLSLCAIATVVFFAICAPLHCTQSHIAPQLACG